MVAPFFDEEGERHGTEGHVSVPAVPGANVIISKSDLSFGVTKSVLYPEALALDAHQLRERGFSGSIADDVVNFCRVADFANGKNGPSASVYFVVVPEPDALTDGLYS